MNEVAEFNPKSELPDEFEYVDLESVVGTEMISHRTETKDSAPSRAQRLAQPGDVFFQTVRPYQKNNYLFSKLDNNYVFSTGYAQMRPNIDTAFLMSFLQTDSFVKIVLDNCTGTSYPAINSNDLSNLEISLPKSFEEQKKVGETIISIDNLITLHQRKSFLNFAKRNDWEQRKLGDMGSTFTGLSGKTKEDFGHGDAQFITYMNVFSNPVANLEMTEAVEIDANQNSVKKGDVFFTTSSETPEEVGMSCVMPENKDNIYLNSFCFGYRPTEKFDLDYLAYVLRADSFRKEMTFLAQGISRYNISKNKVMEVSIPVPNLEEQTMIGRYFSTLDHLIALHRRAYYNKKGGLTNVHNDNQQHYAIL